MNKTAGDTIKSAINGHGVGANPGNENICDYHVVG
jgi:hypothetical protein